MKPYHKNPRQITKKRLTALEQNLDKLGDLSGIVHDLNTDNIIGGNQRMRVFTEGQPEIIEQYDVPDEQGTIAHGFIVWHGKKYAYRQVQWDRETAEEANIKANLGAGVFDWDIVANEWDSALLQDWGMDSDTLQQWQTDAGALGLMLDSGPNFEPVGADQQPRLDQKSPVYCPHCGLNIHDEAETAS